MYVPTQPLWIWIGPEDQSLTKCIAQYLYKNIYRLKTGLPIVSSLQSSVLLVTPGRELSKADIPTPNILADPSHLQIEDYLSWWLVLLVDLILGKYKDEIITFVPEGSHVCTLWAGRPLWTNVLKPKKFWRSVTKVFKFQLSGWLWRWWPVGISLWKHFLINF